jgi:hypothetical protein
VAATRSAIAATVSPNPVVAGPGGTGASGNTFPFGASFTVTVTESAGLACNINRVNMSFPPSTGSLQYGAADVSRLAGTNFVQARGSLAIPFSILYSGTRQATLQVSVEAIDANGNTVTALLTVQIV